MHLLIALLWLLALLYALCGVLVGGVIALILYHKTRNLPRALLALLYNYVMWPWSLKQLVDDRNRR